MENEQRVRGGFGRRRFGNFASGPKPVSVGEVLELNIEATGSKGDGIARKDGFVIFVKGAAQGQTVKAKIVAIGRSSATAEIVSGESEQPKEPLSEQSQGEDGEDLQ